MAIHVKSEIGKLKKVMLHRPGQELEHLVPEDLERLLFDDIPYLKTAKIEHDMFAEIMRGQGVEVVYLEDMTAEVLKIQRKRSSLSGNLLQRAVLRQRKSVTSCTTI